MYRKNFIASLIVICIIFFSLISCSANNESSTVEIDGSSTVFPISMAAAEIFRETHPEIQIPVGISGTGGGFKRFTVGEIPISDASRPIKDQEVKDATENGIDFIEKDFGWGFSLYELKILKPAKKINKLVIKPIIPIKLIAYIKGYFGRINSPKI